MLEYLHVKNVALIKECEIDFKSGLNILTGETGAGKSILLGSLNLCLGGRADKSMIRSGETEALVELSFSADERTRERLRSLDLSADDTSVLISRKITQDKSIFKINGETCLVKQVKEVAEGLIDIHGQHEHQTLLNNVNQRELIDSYDYDEIKDVLLKVKETAGLYKKLSDEYEELKAKSKDAQREAELLEYECNEIEEAGLKPGEDEELEEKYRLMKAGQKLSESISEAISYVSADNGQDAGSLLSRAIQRMNQVVSVDENADAMLCKLNDAEALLGDFAIEASEYLEKISYDDETFQYTEERLDLINTMKSRYAGTIEGILQLLESKSEELSKLKNLDEYLCKLEKDVEAAQIGYNAACNELTALRRKSADAFSKDLKEALSELNFLGVEFEVDMQEVDIISANGRDSIEFLISTNPGEPVKPLKNVASGGELSRVMLAIKTIMADKDSIDSLVFDEIDAGISGKTAWEVSKKLARLSREHQVIAITHLAQIAAMADYQFEIKKDVYEGSTQTSIAALDKDGRVSELSRLLGGSGLSDAAEINAHELLNQAELVKAGY